MCYLSACLSPGSRWGKRTNDTFSFSGFVSLLVFDMPWAASFLSVVGPVLTGCLWSAWVCSLLTCKSLLWLSFLFIVVYSTHPSPDTRDRGGLLLGSENTVSSVSQYSIFLELANLWICHNAKLRDVLCTLCRGNISEFPIPEHSQRMPSRSDYVLNQRSCLTKLLLEWSPMLLFGIPLPVTRIPWGSRLIPSGDSRISNDGIGQASPRLISCIS